MTAPSRAEVLLALADRVEKAMGADRALGREVLLACGFGYVSPLQRWMNPTGSLDAAMEMVPDGWQRLMGDDPDSDALMCGLFRDGFDDVTAYAQTLARALTAASLRARAHALGSKDHG